ncbi:MAG: 1-deoxy-D-xylulose-5-phosphate reductoisomerase, partial [Lachnospiraceae bacterium]|nr:1-deoxy-D-xylulose-5-phosphate reductoisomerase [Lachnospiraceae bacterium]
IQYALYYPNRRTLGGKRLDFYEMGNLTFERPDMETFEGLALAMSAMRQGGNMPTVFNAANERAVAMFLDKKIGFWEILEIIKNAMGDVPFIEEPNLEEVLITEQTVYEYIESRWKV